MRNRLLSTFAVFAMVAIWAAAASAQTTYTNSTPITINDADVASPYPSGITVAGSTGNITDVNVVINGLSHTFPDDVAYLLVSPSGAKMVIQSDVGGGTDIVGRTYTLDDQAGAGIPDGGPFPANGASARPSSVGDDDTFPPPAPFDCQPAGECPQAAPAGSATLNGTFGGVSANGVWNLYVIDCCGQDAGSISGGWSLIITTSGAPAPVQHVVDFNGDGRTDWSVLRITGAGSPAQVTWFTAYNGAAGGQTDVFGLSSDFFLPEDFDGDNKSDVAVWRPGAAGVAAFYILQSATNTFRGELFGQTGDDPSVVGDYDNDGKADLAVYRLGAANGDQSVWYYRTVANGPVFAVAWGINGPATNDGDFPAPGDYDGDGRNDFVVQRAAGSQSNFWIRFATGTTSVVTFGIPTDTIVPGDYDGDGKTDIAVARGVNGQIQWYYLPSSGGPYVQIPWGSSPSDFLVQGDYDGDGKTDAAVWRPSADSTQNFFYVNRSNGGGLLSFEWGQQGDLPTASYNFH